MSDAGDLPNRPERRRNRHLKFAGAMIGATVALFVFTWYAFSAPGGYADLVFDALGLWVLLGMIWLTWLIASLVVSRFHVSAPTCRRLSHFPVFALLMALAVWLQAPLWLGYFISRPAMNRTANEVLSGKRDPSKIHRIGIYPVSYAWKDGSEYFGFLVKGTEDPSEAGMGEGFAFDKAPIDPSGWRTAPKHMSGHWYRFHQECCGA